MTEIRKTKILCVEDEQEIRENIADILRDEGFEVFEAANGKKGFDVFTKEKPDLVISDIMMPEADGYALLKTVRGSKNIKNNTVPFIFLSALGQKDNVIKGVELSANDYLVKPIDFDLMIAKVKEKTSNAMKVQDLHSRNIKNIKDQVTMVLPSELFSYLDVIVQTSEILKTSPHGDFLSNKTLEDINRIYLNAIKLKSSIANSLDASVIESKLNFDEEIFVMTDFLSQFIGGLSQKIRNRIDIETPFEANKMPRIKVDKSILIDALRRILSAMLKVDLESKISIRIMIDHLSQMVIIFYLNTKVEVTDFSARIGEAQINKVLDQQSCSVKVVNDKEKSVVLTLPKHRLVS